MATSQSVVTPFRVPLLAANQTWTSLVQDRLANEYLHRRARAEVFALQAGTLYIEESDDQAFGTSTILATIAVAASVTPDVPWVKLSKKHYRLRYVNGAAAQTAQMILFLERSGRPVTDVEVSAPVAVGYEALNVTNAAAVALAAVPANATRATVTVEDAEIRVRWDGTAPTTAQGHLAEPFDEVTLMNRTDILNFRAIATTATAANLRVTYS